MTSYACLARCWCRNTRTLTIGKTWSGLELELPGNGRILAGSSRGSGTGRSGVKSLSVDAGKSKDSDVGNCNEGRLTTKRSVDQDGGLKKSTFNISRSSSSSSPWVSVLLLFARRNFPVAFFLPQLPYCRPRNHGRLHHLFHHPTLPRHAILRQFPPRDCVHAYFPLVRFLPGCRKRVVGRWLADDEAGIGVEGRSLFCSWGLDC